MLRVLAVLLVCVLGAACKTVPPPIQPLPEDLSELDRWQARGRLGVSGPQGGGSGSFEWLQRGDRAQVQIRGPVGIGSVRLEVHGTPDDPVIRLETSDGQVLESEAAWAEMEARLGAPVPASSLRYWMLGLPAPGEHHWREETGHGASLEQAGWRIDYQAFSSDPGARVPVRLRATSGAARVRIVVDRWRLGQ
ncbi:MAG: outer membrane lipoprotein LolB [Proteobacteria bacterium]|nr:MAG: outer membrane lipoprotein LolB [Pseudomonadota bacterium]